MFKLLSIVLLIFSQAAYSTESTCYGTTSNGRLNNGAQLPSSGDNLLVIAVLLGWQAEIMFIPMSK